MSRRFENPSMAHHRQFHCSLVEKFLPASRTRCVPAFISPHLTRMVASPQQRPSSMVCLKRELFTEIIENAVAASSIAAPTLLGLSIDGCIKNCNVGYLRKLQGVGALLTILTASFLSSAFGFFSSMHYIHDLCWSRLLPASLSLWLIASTVQEEFVDTSSRGDDTWSEIIAVSIPFALGCIGSMLGCLLSFVFCFCSRNNAVRLHQHIFPGRQHFFLTPGHLVLNPAEAAVAAGCLCSAYIGGPWNYFTTMRILENDDTLPSFARDAVHGVLGGTFGSSASDMLLMPIYFNILQSMVASKRVAYLFPGRCTTKNNDDECSLENKVSKIQDQHISLVDLWKGRLAIVAVIMPVIWAIVRLADACESRSNIVGIGIAINSLLSCSIPAILSKLSWIFKLGSEKESARSLLVDEIKNLTSKMSDMCYYMLLSVIGVSTKRLEIINKGWAPSSSFIFASTSLMIHFAVIILGSFGLMNLLPRCKQFPLRPEEIAVASCAAITGPQAAASLAIKMSHEESKIYSDIYINWKGLALSGTILGVFGYIISCPVGVRLSKYLLQWIEK